ncbi:MAG: bacteriohemerythrin [Thioalkalivibrionaceae bacterium]
MTKHESRLRVPEQEKGFMNDEHHEAARLMDQVLDLCRDGSAPEVADAFEAFMTLNRSHFASEDALMEQVGFPQTEYHRQEHATHLARWEGMLAGLRNGEITIPAFSDALEGEVLPWYQRHFTTLDALLSKFAHMKAQG